MNNCQPDSEFNNTLISVLKFVYDPIFITIIFSDDKDFIQNISYFFEEEKALEYILKNENPFSKFFGISKVDFKTNLNPEFSMSKKNVDAVTCFLIEELSRKEHSLESLRNLYLQYFNFSQLTEISFLYQYDDYTETELPMNILSFLITLKILKICSVDKINKIKIGLTDEYFMKNDIDDVFNIDLYSCYISLLIFCDEFLIINSNIKIDSKYIPTCYNIIDNFTYNGISFCKFKRIVENSSITNYLDLNALFLKFKT